jgi:hypothetical protein
MSAVNARGCNQLILVCHWQEINSIARYNSNVYEKDTVCIVVFTSRPAAPARIGNGKHSPYLENYLEK